jgi:signal transduction histidine kinase/streptogramin lyase
MKHLTLTILLALFATTGFAQQRKIAFETFNVTEGLPEETVSAIVQDDKGFIWASTQNGLVKYDGYQFNTYQFSPDSNQTTKLQIKGVSGGLFIAADGKIWVGGGGFTDRGSMASFDPETGQFRHYHLPELIFGRPSGTSYILEEDSLENIWFGNLADFMSISPIAYLGRINQLDGSLKMFPDTLMIKSIIGLVVKNTEELNGSIWMLDAQNNVKKWNPDTDIFETIIPGGTKLYANEKQDTIRWIKKASNNRLFINGDHTFYIYDVKNLQVLKSYRSSDSNSKGLIAGNILAAVEDEMGYYWLMHSGGILTRIHPDSDNIQTYEFGKGELAFPGAPESVSDVFIILHQNNNGIWFQSYSNTTGNSCFLYYDFAGQNFSFYDNDFNVPANALPTMRSSIFGMMEDRTGLLWLYTRPGMYKQSPKKRQMELYRHQTESPDGLPCDSVNYLFEDSKERLWIGTRNGLALYQPDSDNFRIFRHDPAIGTSVSHNNISAIVEDADGKIWVGTENGLNLWQESTGVFKRFFYSPKERNYCSVLFSDNQHRLWLAVANKGVFVLDKSTGKILKSYMPNKTDPSAINNTAINNIYQDRTGNIWLGSFSTAMNPCGLFRLTQAEDGFIHYLPNPLDSKSISNRRTSFIAEDGKNRLWIGTDIGLNLYDRDNDCFTVFHNARMSSMTSFCVDKNGEPWFGVYSGGGLVSVDTENGTITAYDETKGLLHNDLTLSYNNRIVSDNSGRFWLPTQRGLSVFDPETRSFVSYYEKDGFQPYGRRYNTLKTSNGDIWIGGRNGLNHIIPSELLKKDTTLPSVAITQVKILDSLYSIPDGKIFKKSVAYTNDFQLKHWQKDISYDFVALHFLRPEDNLYSWKLENYDKEWSAPSKERRASYTNLSPGDYVFQVKASNADGVWNEEGVSVAMTILPPWWLTWWAYAGYVLLFLLALRSYSLWRLRNLRMEKEHLQQKVEERTSELKNSLEEIKSTQTQLIASEKLASLGALTAGIAHEIQNPLNFVNNFAEVSIEMIDEVREENVSVAETRHTLSLQTLDDVRQNLEKISHHGKRAESIVKGMLLHSRGSSGHKEPTDINSLCDEYLRLSYHGFRAKDKSFNADYKTDLDPNLPKINVVPQDIGRVLLNLINNAFYAVQVKTHGGASLQQTPPPHKPTVTVSTQKNSHMIEISVKDNGPGIPDAIKDKIFQPFFTTKPTGQGTGLGLSLAYDIVKAHGGEIRIESKNGEGTEFIVLLPQLHHI